MITKFKIFEYSVSNDSEYYDAVANHYDEDLIEEIKQGEQMAFRMAGVRNAVTEKSDSGNLFMRYVLGRNQYMGKILCILGAVAKSGKMEKGDVEDMKKWIRKAIDYLKDGYTIMTSPNKLSSPLIEKIIKLAEKDGIELDIDKNINVHQSGDMSWDSYIIKKI